MLCLAGIHLNYCTDSVFVNHELWNDKIITKPHPLSRSLNHQNNKVKNTVPCQVPAYDYSSSVHFCSSAYNIWSENRANENQKNRKEVPSAPWCSFCIIEKKKEKEKKSFLYRNVQNSSKLNVTYTRPCIYIGLKFFGALRLHYVACGFHSLVFIAFWNLF